MISAVTRWNYSPTRMHKKEKALAEGSAIQHSIVLFRCPSLVGWFQLKTSSAVAAAGDTIRFGLRKRLRERDVPLPWDIPHTAKIESIL